MQSYIPKDGSVLLVAEFFQSAAALYRAAPWERLASIPMSLDVPGLGVKGACVCWLSETEGEGVLLVCPSLEIYRASLAPGGGACPGAIVLLLQEGELEKTLAEEVSQHQWELEGSIYPRLATNDMSGAPTPVDARAYLLMGAACDAVSLLLSMHSHQLSKEVHLREELELKRADGALAVTISFPHEAARRNEARRPPTWQEQLIDAFCSSDPEIKSEGLTEHAAYLCAELLEFKAVYQNEEPLDWRPKDVSEFMLSYFPFRVMATPELVREVPSLLSSFFRWMEGLGRIKSARSFIRQVTSNRSTFLRYAEDPRFFGEAKADAIRALRSL